MHNDNSTEKELLEGNELVMAHIHMFSQMENDDAIYFVTHSCHLHFKKVLFLTIIWMKMYNDILINDFNRYKDCNINNCLHEH